MMPRPIFKVDKIDMTNRVVKITTDELNKSMDRVFFIGMVMGAVAMMLAEFLIFYLIKTL